MTNVNNRVLYTGLTNNLPRRVAKHRVGVGSRFTSRYRVTKLVWYEEFARIADAIAAEKRIKGGSREKKIRLVEGVNPGWRDLLGDG
jgi:putative endonuclease